MIDSNTLLQTDATVIAGVLILLTIYALKPVPRFGLSRNLRVIVAWVIVLDIFPFSASACFILLSPFSLSPSYFLSAPHLAGIGFIYLMAAVTVILLIPFIKLLLTTKDEEDEE